MKVIRLSALRTGHLYASEDISSNYFSQRLSQPESHSAAGRIMSMKNSNNTNGNRTRDLPACSTVPQPTAPPAACPQKEPQCHKNSAFSYDIIRGKIRHFMWPSVIPEWQLTNCVYLQVVTQVKGTDQLSDRMPSCLVSPFAEDLDITAISPQVQEPVNCTGIS